MSTEVFLEELDRALREERLDVERVEDTFNVRLGTGIMAQRAHIDPQSLFEELADLGDKDQTLRRRQIAGFASGVKHVLLEPARSPGRQWDFIRSAGGLLPTIEVTSFTEGVRQAAGESAWTRDFFDDLRLAYIIRLTRGLRVLTEPQMNDWGVSADRVTAAARSLLFHRTRDLRPQKFESFSKVYRLQGGDGHDAARCLVIADAFFTEIDDSFRFTIPTPNHLLFTYHDDPASISELRTATDEVLSENTHILTGQIFRVQSGKPMPDETL